MTQPFTLQVTTSINNQLKDIELLFDIIQSDSINIESDITDHYVENNTAVQDTMAIKPIELTLRGLVGEKVYEHSLMVTDKISGAFSKIAPIGALIPPISSYANVVVNASAYIESSVKRYIETFKNIKDIFNKNKTPNQSKQYTVCQNLISLRDNRTFVTVTTPFGKFENMLILSANMEQGETKSLSELVVTVKQYKSVAVEMVKVDSKKYAGRLAEQKAMSEDLGKVQGAKQELTSTLYRSLFGG